MKRRKSPRPNSLFRPIQNVGKRDDLESRWLLLPLATRQRILGLEPKVALENRLESIPASEQLTRKGRRRSPLHVILGQGVIDGLAELGQGLFLTSARLPKHQAALRETDSLRGDAERGDPIAAAMSDADEDVTLRMENRLLLRALRSIKAVGRIGLLPLKVRPEKAAGGQTDVLPFRLVQIHRPSGLDFPKI